jgi:DNA-binding transcriptional ArsR family regulator
MGKGPRDLNELRKAKRQETIKQVSEAIINSGDHGMTIKEIAIQFRVSGNTAGEYISELYKQDLIDYRKEGKTRVWTWAPPKVSSEEVEKAEQEAFEIAEEVHPGGRIFEEVKPAHNVDQGDVVWCSSRSGDGQFFRYLVMVPWERKATVIGVIPEGHPCYNANDARYVPIGVDPETGEKLFADISNTCSRGYAQFGEKLMKVSAENMSELKSVMSRYHRIPQKLVPVTKVDDNIWKKRFEELNTKLKASMNSASVNGTKVAELTEANDDLKQQLKAAYLECDEKKQACEEAQKTAKDAIDEIERLKFANDSLRTSVDHLQSENKALEEAAAQHVESDVIFTEDTKETIDSLLWKISLLEQELKDKNEMITVLKQITFKSLAKGGE